MIISNFNSCASSNNSSQDKVKTQTQQLIELRVKNKKIKVELAKTPEERAKGLMERNFLAEDSGMLFIFEEAGIYPFWMKNTKIPLSIAFINEDKVIIEIMEMVPNQDIIHYAPTQMFRYALEMNQGWFLKNGINIGDTIWGIPD